MLYHSLAPEGSGKFHWKKYQNARSFFQSHTSKINQQKQRDVASKSAAKIYPSNKYDLFPVISLLTNHETPYILNIVLSFHSPFEPITALLKLHASTHLLSQLLPFFEITGMWPEDLTLLRYGLPKHQHSGEMDKGLFILPKRHDCKSKSSFLHDSWLVSLGLFVDWLQSLKQFFINVSSYTCSQSYSDGSVLKQSHQSKTGYKCMMWQTDEKLF